MRTKRENNVSVMLGRLLYIGFSAQIVFGIIWMAKNIVYVQMFGDASYNLTRSSMFMGDGDVGILYPTIILLTRALGQITYVPWFSYLYLIQLALAFSAGYFLIKEAGIFGNKARRRVWGSLVMLTFPPILQIHMAILVNSLVLSLFMLQSALTIRSWKTIKNKKSTAVDYVYAISGVLLFWLLMSLTKWIYIFIGAIPVLAVFVGIIVASIRNNRAIADKLIGKLRVRRSILLVLITVTLFVGLTLGVDRLTTDSSISQRTEFDIDKKLFERMAWKSRFYRQGTWLLEVQAVVDPDTMEQASLYQENIKLLVLPMIEENLDEDEAKELIRFVNRVVWNNDRKEFLHDIAIDTAGYMLPPVVMRMLIEKNSYISYTPRNYDSFKRNAPVLSKYYVDYSLLWFEASLIICAVIMLLKAIGKTIKTDKNVAGAYAVIIVACMCIAFRNVMLGNSVYDYKEAGSAIIAWFMVIFVSCSTAIFDEEV